MVNLQSDLLSLDSLSHGGLELSEELRIQRAVINAASHFIIATRMDGIVVLFNAAAERLLGYTAEEVVGKTTPVIFHDVEEVKAAARELAQELGRPIRPGLDLFVTKTRLNPEEQEWTFVRKDGSRFYASLSVTELLDEVGNVTGYLGIGTEITQRKRADAALRRSEEQFRTLATSSPVGIFHTDAQGYCLYTNARWQEIAGLTEAESRGHGWLSAVHPEDLPTVIERWERYLREPSSLSVEFRFLHKNGTVRTVMTRVAEIRAESGEIVGFVGTNEDITERKATEAELVRARDAALEATNAKSLFLASMSHELRTPMNGVLGMADLLMQTPMTPEQRECAETIHSSGEALLTLLNDILDLSKIESGKLELESVCFDLRKIVHDTTQLFSQIASRRGVLLTCQIAPEVPPAVVGDMVRVRQVLSNLISNAIKFTEQGHVTVIVRPERCDSEGDASIRVSVSDSGIGIDQQGVARLFQNFSQADASTFRRYGGTGLGLAISRRLVQLMDGDMAVESEPGKGSTFHFTIRLQRAHAVVESSEPAPMALNLSGVKILVAEDNRTNQIVIRRYLERRGCVITVVEDGRAALATLEAETFDLVLMDCHMPEMDGYEATRRLRERELEQQTPALPVIALTASAMSDDRGRCLAAGMNDFLTKPLQFGQLDNTLQRWLSARN